ncbi:class III poly(R)-hydroxyalkanoic acid synthase subunit PhaE [Luteimonas sp. 3794]|uniref:class III poly(R)-hydroxyalkanoic acid synthase subunit PhaE n=1 Tax=Luteimonas sp. 3794 TaxID=2817730 RepID=UPI002856EAD0|nr:class III poly(R)-hydroxyalkanoic acid synthase subunit PhaE [Luteimonas sp. 3794]MDR6992094.1 class III poly(R)-hydroxyalkanoic acid synthase PhaE subunit [Luteimonas sp. 3794]
MIERGSQESTMFNMGQGPDAQAADLERLARRYWDTWRDALQRTMPGNEWNPMGAAPSSAGAAPWGDPSQWFKGAQAPETGADALRQFQSMAGPWLEQMQRVAAGFVGREASPEAITAAWREAMGGNPVGKMFGGLQGPGIEGWETWLQRLKPWLDAAGASQAMGHGGRDAFALPTFGLTREHQERWQHLGRAFAEYQRSQQDYQTLLMQASTAAFGIFERKLAARDPATPIETARALFDLWIDAAEEAYAEVALSPAFRKAYADMVGGQMRLRQAVQREVEQACRVLDLPTRTELDGAHRKIADLERTLRRVRDRLDAVDGAGAQTVSTSDAPTRRTAGPTRVVTPAAPEAASGGATPAATRAAPPSSAKKRAPAKKAATKKAATKKAPARKTAAKKTSARTTASKTAATDKAVSRQSVASKPSRKTAAAKKAAAKKAPAKTAVAKSDTAATPRPASRRRSPAAATKAVSRGTRAARRNKSAAAAPARASRKAARTPTRVGSLPNLGFISPIPLAPEPLQGKRGTSRKGKR